MGVDWSGVFPALTTKFHPDDSLDMEMFNRSIEFQLEAGVNGIILGGSLGEASVLMNEERSTLVRHAVELVDGRIPIILNIAEGATRDAIKQATLATAMGCSGIMVLPPMRYNSDHRETVTYFKTFAASTDLPIMIYNNPVDYKIDVTPDMFDELQSSENITGIKESTRDVTNITRLINRFGTRYKILCGVDTLAMEELVLGADGWVAGLVCAFPRETVAIYRLVKAGHIAEAAAIYRWFMPLLELDIHAKLVQYIKLAETQAGIGSEHVRAPRLTLIGEERERVLSIINQGLATRPELPEYLQLNV